MLFKWKCYGYSIFNYYCFIFWVLQTENPATNLEKVFAILEILLFYVLTQLFEQYDTLKEVR